MPTSDLYLVHFNMAIARFPSGHPGMAGFAEQLDAVSDLARASPGFVWTPDGDEAGDAVAVFGHDRVLANISMWTSLEALKQFTYRGQHGDALRRRREWFEVSAQPAYALWWALAEPHPTWHDAKRRIDMLTASGPTAEAFTFSHAFDATGRALPPTPAGSDTA